MFHRCKSLLEVLIETRPIALPALLLENLRKRQKLPERQAIVSQGHDALRMSLDSEQVHHPTHRRIPNSAKALSKQAGT